MPWWARSPISWNQPTPTLKLANHSRDKSLWIKNNPRTLANQPCTRSRKHLRFRAGCTVTSSQIARKKVSDPAQPLTIDPILGEPLMDQQPNSKCNIIESWMWNGKLQQGCVRCPAKLSCHWKDNGQLATCNSEFDCWGIAPITQSGTWRDSLGVTNHRIVDAMRAWFSKRLPTGQKAVVTTRYRETVATLALVRWLWRFCVHTPKRKALYYTVASSSSASSVHKIIQFSLSEKSNNFKFNQIYTK